MLRVRLASSVRAIHARGQTLATSTPLTGARSFSNFRPNVLQSLPKRTTNAFGLISLSNFARFNSTGPSTLVGGQTAQNWTRFAITAGAVAGGAVLIQGFLNRETRDALSEAERSYLNDSFTYTGGGLALTALAARSLFRSGAAFRIMSANPWVVLGVSLVGSIGSMMGVYYTDPRNTVQKHTFWLAFNACQAATLSPLFFLNPAILGRAALYTAGVVGSLSYVGATAKNDQYLYMGGPLLAGLAVVALSSLAPMVLPVTAARTLAITESISLYGGLAVFSGFVLFDTQKIIKHGQMAAQGVIPRDPLRESIALELDMINIFIRLVQILAMQQNRKK